jgi:hypothetical protein
MKSNRILQIVLIGLVIVVIAVCGYLLTANSSQTKKQTQLKDTLNQSQVIYANGLAQKAALETTATTLASQLASAQALLAQSTFRSSAQSIEYDEKLYSIANASNVNITSLTSGSPSTVTVQNTTYKVTTFNLAVTGLTPDTIFKNGADDISYINSVVKNIMNFKTAIDNSPDFNTAIIKPVNISEPTPMTDATVQGLITNINSIVATQQAAAIAASTAQVTLADAGETQAQITADITTATNQIIAKTIAAATPAQITALMAQAGVPSPTGTFTISVWTY